MDIDEVSHRLGQIEGITQATHDNVLELKKWLIAHEATDRTEFASVRQDIKDINKYASSIAVVAGVFGIGLAAAWDWIKKKAGIS